MARGEKKLTAKTVEAIKAPGRYGDGGGLWLQVTPTGTKAWLLRFMLNGRARAMGLGPLDLISLAEARERAREARRKLLDGADPIEARKAQRTQKRLDEAQAVTFEQAAERYIAAHEAGWRHTKSAKQWRSSLNTYAYPTIGKLPVASINTALVLKVIEPIWATTSETASRLRGRIENVLDWAKVRNYREGENPARWRGHLDKLLPATAKLAKVKHHPALPYIETPQFMRELRNNVGVAARSLEFLILTASRTSEATKATWPEINFEAKLWTVPASRMKAEKEHRVPLSDRAIEILKSLPIENNNNHIFVGARAGKPLSHEAMLELMRQLKPGYVPHGFRSTFRDWAAEQTNFPNHVVEMALAHTVGNKIEAAYRRGDLFDKRRELMDQWNKFLG